MPSEDDNNTATTKLKQKAKDDPMMIIGLVGLVGVCGLGAYRFRNRGDMKVSQFLMQLRVAAQGVVVGALSLGAIYSFSQRLMENSKKSKLSNENTNKPK